MIDFAADIKNIIDNISYEEAKIMFDPYNRSYTDKHILSDEHPFDFMLKIKEAMDKLYKELSTLKKNLNQEVKNKTQKYINSIDKLIPSGGTSKESNDKKSKGKSGKNKLDMSPKDITDILASLEDSSGGGMKQSKEEVENNRKMEALKARISTFTGTNSDVPFGNLVRSTLNTIINHSQRKHQNIPDNVNGDINGNNVIIKIGNKELKIDSLKRENLKRVLQSFRQAAAALKNKEISDRIRKNMLKEQMRKIGEGSTAFVSGIKGNIEPDFTPIDGITLDRLRNKAFDIIRSLIPRNMISDRKIYKNQRKGIELKKKTVIESRRGNNLMGNLAEVKKRIEIARNSPDGKFPKIFKKNINKKIKTLLPILFMFDVSGSMSKVNKSLSPLIQVIEEQLGKYINMYSIFFAENVTASGGEAIKNELSKGKYFSGIKVNGNIDFGTDPFREDNLEFLSSMVKHVQAEALRIVKQRISEVPIILISDREFSIGDKYATNMSPEEMSKKISDLLGIKVRIIPIDVRELNYDVDRIGREFVRQVLNNIYKVLLQSRSMLSRM